ncbi:hypothetical protein V6N11_068687 [Hibiscus sabdariffa]|uniref:Uncharacterized protein n=1 Tax=Hibiscus sabdariffa TaxID=183260 RepID=A0ABR2PAG2_9ROSI
MATNHGSILPPSPPALRLIGHLHMKLFDNSSTHIFLWKLSQKYGSLLYLRLGCKLTIMVSSAKMTKEVLKTHDLDFCSRPDQHGDFKPVNLSEALMCLSSTIICRVGFGKMYDGEGAERSRFHVLLNESQALLTSFCFADTLYQELIDEHLDPNRPKPAQENMMDVLLQISKDDDFPFDLIIDHIKAILMVITSLSFFQF